MLTKRLYRFEEVRAAFLYTLKQGRLKEAHFWLDELEDSMYGGEVRRLLFLSWLMRIGVQNLTWLEVWACDSETREGRWRLCWQLIRCKDRDSSIWLLLWSVVLASDDLLVKRQDLGRLFVEWLSTCKKEDEEFWQPLVDASNDERIDRILVALQTNMKKYDLFAKAAALTLVYGSKRLDLCWPTVSHIEECPEPAVETTIRDGRRYTIPYDCLFGMTARGCGLDTTEELRSLGEKEFAQSPYWRTKWPSASHLTDDTLETFWDTHFPWTNCDHPDEWPLVEQQKSHGSSVPMGPLARWWSNWVPKDHLFVWGSVYRNLERWIQSQRTNNSILDTLLGLYKQFQTPCDLPNYPIQKEFVLTSV